MRINIEENGREQNLSRILNQIQCCAIKLKTSLVLYHIQNSNLFSSPIEDDFAVPMLTSTTVQFLLLFLLFHSSLSTIIQ